MSKPGRYKQNKQVSGSICTFSQHSYRAQEARSCSTARHNMRGLRHGTTGSSLGNMKHLVHNRLSGRLLRQSCFCHFLGKLRELLDRGGGRNGGQYND